MSRFATDFSEFSPGPGLPAGFAADGAAATYEVVAKPGALGGQALRVTGDAEEVTRVLWTAAAGALQYGEIYARVTTGGWGIAANLLGFKYTLMDVSSVVRTDPDNPGGAIDTLLSNMNRYAGPGSYDFVLRVDAGRVRGMLWRPADDGPWDTWLFDLTDTNPAAPPAGAWGVQTVGTADIEWIGIGTDGDDAPRPETALEAPRRPEAAVDTSEGAATLQPGAYTSPAGSPFGAVRYRVAVSNPDDASGERYLFDGGEEVLDTGWLGVLEPYAWNGAATDEDYALEVTFRDAALRESAPGMLVWFTTGEVAGRIVEGLAGFDLFGHRPPGCSDGVPAPDGGGLIGGITVTGLPEGAGVLIERAGDVLHPLVPNPFGGGDYPQPVEADAAGGAVVTLPADAVAVRVYSRPRRPQGNAAAQFTDLDADRDLLLRYEPEHGPQPGDVLLWTTLPALAAPENVAAESEQNTIRFTVDAVDAVPGVARTRWRVWSRFGTCPVLVYDTGWSTDLTAHGTTLPNLPVGFSTFITATYQDIRGVIGAASEPLVYRVPLALFYGPPSGGLEYQAEFQTSEDEYAGTSSVRRPDAISLDYLTAFCIGPEAVGDASLGLFRRAWRLRCVNGADGGSLLLARSSVTLEATRAGAEGAWETEVEIFAFTGATALEVDVAFEQAGRPVVCMERATGGAGAAEVWLYWYDPRIPGFTLENLGAGRNPRILLDDPESPPESDVLLFYISDSNDRLEMRQQGEFYAVPHTTPIENVAQVYCEEVAFARDNRLHVILSVRDVASGRYALAALESAPYPVRLFEALDVRVGLLSALAAREGFVVQPGGVENTSDPDLLDVSTSLVSLLVVDLVLVSTPDESLDTWLSIVSASRIDLTIYPPISDEALDVEMTLMQADAATYIIFPAVQGPESLDVSMTFTSADAVAL
jgi:hypothetical protein